MQDSSDSLLEVKYEKQPKGATSVGGGHQENPEGWCGRESSEGGSWGGGTEAREQGKLVLSNDEGF